MNKNYIASVFALLLLIGTGIYWYNTSPTLQDYNDPREGGERIELINGEKIVLETPLTESFSNAESNKNLVKKTEKKKTSSTYQGAVATIIDTVKKPFFIGIYYVETIRQRGLNACTGNNDTINAEIIPGEYLDSDGEIELTRIEKILDQVFIYINADESPNNICARLIRSEEFDDIDINPIHFIIE
jgi:hypothetical protein